ncbi:hypothetical protein LEP1GSC188_3149 [Leptospira weilii serovar Topaz str. LT2116]|uniref:DUF6998 domain-containing protein n=1 Tax=Leptospira weilii serovar Topaz str. LT2116 TaxID=1088540 RepID=M3EIN6_9LEPT|nr:hypothetical protein LEP1GSC188_3149 [Leptospira weilii serovar Topaz str. LT2116]
MIVLKLKEDGEFQEIYNGKGNRVWNLIKNRKVQSTDITQFRLTS